MSSSRSRDVSASVEWDSDGSDSDISQGEDISSTAECIRKVSNFSAVKPHDILDKPVFDPEYLALRLEQSSPKLIELFKRIALLDAQDREKHGRVFKHMIFSDQASSTYGAKLIASAMIAKGFTPAFHLQGKGFHVLADDKLEETRGNNFGLLLSKPLFDRSLSVPFKKALLDKFNRRPDNVEGDLIRFIVLDQGFKEGIDLFDVKYVHLLEPLINAADEKQAIGRGTRFCGQKGLSFHPTFGWPLYVFRYDVKRGSKTLHELVLDYSDIDFKKIVFAAELENATIEGAVDHELTSPVHGFSIPHPPPILGAASTSSVYASAREFASAQDGGARGDAAPPRTKFTSSTAMVKYVADNFKGRFTYPAVKLENMCGGARAKAAAAAPELPPGTLVNFTPTQDFVRHYFTPSSPYKGMLLWHSVGTGKTCTAIATATTGFEPEGYNILWVTRHTLKSDIFKNLFRQVCSLVLQEKLRKGEMTLPKKLSGPMKHLSANWIEPISYKQFTNLLLKKNKYYEEMVRRNGKEDPLRKTLLVIDEAHKLYSPSVAAAEKPNTDILEDMIQHSYAVSGANSVRLLVMTATPYTEDGMELVQLLNLMRPKNEALPVDFEAFGKKFLSADGTFTAKGKKDWLNAIAGYVSYLNRSKDARNFAYPVLENVIVPLSKRLADPKKIPEDGIKFQMNALKDDYKEARKTLREETRAKKAQMKYLMKDMVAEAKEGAQEDVEKCMAEIDVLIAEQQQALAAALDACAEAHNKRGEGAAKKACIADAKAASKEKVAKLKDDKKDCKKMKKSINRDAVKAEWSAIVAEELKPIQEAFANNTAVYRGLKEKYDDLNVMRRENRFEIKELKERYKVIRGELEKLKNALDDARAPLKKIKNKAEKKAAQQRVAAEFGAPYKQKYREYLDTKAPISGLLAKNKVLRIKQGATTVGDLSQESALDKKCKI